MVKRRDRGSVTMMRMVEARMMRTEQQSAPSSQSAKEATLVNSK